MRVSKVIQEDTIFNSKTRPLTWKKYFGNKELHDYYGRSITDGTHKNKYIRALRLRRYIISTFCRLVIRDITQNMECVVLSTNPSLSVSIRGIITNKIIYKNQTYKFNSGNSFLKYVVSINFKRRIVQRIDYFQDDMKHRYENQNFYSVMFPRLKRMLSSMKTEGFSWPMNTNEYRNNIKAI